MCLLFGAILHHNPNRFESFHQMYLNGSISFSRTFCFTQFLTFITFLLLIYMYLQETQLFIRAHTLLEHATLLQRERKNLQKYEILLNDKLLSSNNGRELRLIIIMAVSLRNCSNCRLSLNNNVCLYLSQDQTYYYTMQ